MKKFQSIGVLLSAITLLLVVLLVSVFTYSAGQAYARREDAARLLKTVDVLRNVYIAEDALRSEQGAVITALTIEAPVGSRVKNLLERLHHAATAAILATRDSSRVESGGPPPNVARILQTLAVYQQRYVEIMRALNLPGEARRKSMGPDWTEAVNGVAAAINLRTRERSMYIADSTPANNEMTKIIRIVWAMRDTAGKDRRVLADAMILKKKITTQELQDFAEQEGNIDSPWAVIQNDDVSLPTFPPELKPAVASFNNLYLGQIHVARRAILNGLSAGEQPPLTARQWLTLSDRELETITAISTTAFAVTRANVADALDQANRELDIALVLMVLSISLASFTLLYR